MENIIYTYDKDQSRKTGQFTVVLTPAVFNRGRWDITKGTKPLIIDIGRHMEIHRNRAVEEGFKATLLSHGFCARPDRNFNWRVPERPLESLVPSLENHGFAVKIGNRRISGAPVSARWTVKTRKQHIRVGGTFVSEGLHIGADGLLQAFQEGKRFVARSDGVLNAAMEILSAGHKILIFSQFTRHLKLIEGFFRSRDIPTYYLDGQTADRGAVVQAFKSHAGACPFFISLKAGGTGLNLSEATYVFLLDPWWNPAVENQAIDRCHRIGQHQPVTIYRFITRDSIEEKVDELKTIKKQIESAVIDETAPQYLPFDEKTLKGLILDQHL